MQTQASLEEHIQSVLESKIQTLLVKERDQNKAEIFTLSNKLSKLEDETDDLRNRSMRSTLIFRGISEEEQNDSWKNVTKHLVNTLFEHIEHRKTKVNQYAGRYSSILLTGAMLTTLEDDSSSFMLQNNQTSLSRKCLQNDLQREGMKH